MTERTRTKELQDEYETYLLMWEEAREVEGPTSALALFARDLVEEVYESWKQSVLLLPPDVTDAVAPSRLQTYKELQEEYATLLRYWSFARAQFPEESREVARAYLFLCLCEEKLSEYNG